MSDKKKSLDLDTAQQLYIAAGQPEQARAAGFVIDAVRNTVQGEWGKSFVSSLEGILIKHITPLVDGQKETQDAIGALGTHFQAIEQDVQALADRMAASEVDRAAIRAQLAALDTDALSDIRQRLVVLEDWKEQVAALRADFSALSARIGGALPTEADQEESAHLRAERDEAAGDGNT